MSSVFKKNFQIYFYEGFYMFKLKELRREKGLTQAEVAKDLNITTAQYQRYEAERSCPRADDLPELADYFGVSIDRLFGREKINSFHDRTSPVPEVQKLFDKLDPAEQAAVIQMMKTLIREKKNIPIEG